METISPLTNSDFDKLISSISSVATDSKPLIIKNDHKKRKRESSQSKIDAIKTEPTDAIAPDDAGEKEQTKTKKRRCGQCEGCKKEDCGECKYCLDKPKFGGPGTIRKKCRHKECSQMIISIL